MTRQRPPNRRPSTTIRAAWATEGAEHRFYITAGFEPQTGRVIEVFYADGQKSGTSLRDTVQDACILISLLLQHGESAEAIRRRLADGRVFGEIRPATAIGVIAEAVAEMDNEAGA